ncbi:MAG: hypothetical protein IKT68_02090, partial [Clostridia bacterium]|nr:hypothetical protein [Clostridia bacterium]
MKIGKKAATKWALLLLFVCFGLCGCSQPPKTVVSMTLPWHCQVTLCCDQISLAGRLTQELPACYDLAIQEPAVLAGLTFVQKNGLVQLQYADLERTLENGLPNTSVFRLLIHGLEQWQRQTLSLSHGGETERVYVGN